MLGSASCAVSVFTTLHALSLWSIVSRQHSEWVLFPYRVDGGVSVLVHHPEKVTCVVKGHGRRVEASVPQAFFSGMYVCICESESAAILNEEACVSECLTKHTNSPASQPHSAQKD